MVVDGWHPQIAGCGDFDGFVFARLAADFQEQVEDFALTLDPSPSGGGNEGEGEILNLLLEVSGEARKDKAAKVATARNLWVLAINNHGGFGRWAFLEINDPWDAINTLRASVQHNKERNP